MKRTTYIIICTIAVVLVFSFFLPAMIRQQKDVRSLTLSATGREVSRELPAFHTIRFAKFKAGEGQPEGFQPVVDVVVMESDTLIRPVVMMDSVWEANAELNVRNEVLTLTPTFRQLTESAGKPSGHLMVQFDISPESHTMARILVPKGMLRNILAEDCMVTLSGFRDASLHVLTTGNNLRILDSSFRNLATETYTPNM